MDRKTIRAIIENAELDDNTKISNILTAYHDKVADIKSGLKTDEDVSKAVAEALKKAPNTAKVVDTDEYKTLKQEFDDHKYNVEMTGQLKTLKVKDKFMADVIAKIKRGEGVDAVDKQVASLAEQFGEYFDADGKTPPPQAKPQFGSDTHSDTKTQEAKPIPKMF